MRPVEKRMDRIASLETLRKRMQTWLVKEKAQGIFQIDRAVFTDKDVFEMEMKYFFERNWVFLAHESQIPNPHDFITTSIGRVPVLITRDRSGAIRGMVNACAHRGARVCRQKAGNKKNFMCPFHGWTYSSTGDLIDVTDEALGGYASGFNRADFGLSVIARVESYRGFVFGSLVDEVMPLTEYLAGSKAFIDLMVDQAETGKLEVLPGTTRYRYRGNWKLQVENGMDGYHVGTVHANYFLTVQRRVQGESLGIFGMGDIGARIARRAAAFGMEVIYRNRRRARDEAGARFVDSLEAFLGSTDVLLLAAPSTEETRNFLDRRQLALARDGIVVVDIARGDLVDEEALLEALQSGKVRAAGLDVFRNEPHIDQQFLELPNVVATPHIGSATEEARRGMARILCNAIEAWQRGERPANQVVESR